MCAGVARRGCFAVSDTFFVPLVSRWSAQFALCLGGGGGIEVFNGDVDTMITFKANRVHKDPMTWTNATTIENT